MFEGIPVVDVHIHAARRTTLKVDRPLWALGQKDTAAFDRLYDDDGRVVPPRFDALLEDDGVDVGLLMCEYSPKVTGIQPIEDNLPLVAQNPHRFRLFAALNPHYHFPVADELERQLELGAIALKIHPVHAGCFPNDRALFPAYEVCRRRGIPVVVHCGTSVFPGAINSYADPVHVDELTQHFPEVQWVLAHGGRGWWYDAAAFLAQSRRQRVARAVRAAAQEAARVLRPPRSRAAVQEGHLRHRLARGARVPPQHRGRSPASASPTTRSNGCCGATPTTSTVSASDL